MKLEGYDFCVEEQFNERTCRPEGIELMAPELLAQLHDKHITSIRLRPIIDRVHAGNGTIAYLEIVTKD